MVSLLVYFAFISSLFLSGYTAPTTIKRADGPGSPYQCASSYGAPNIKDTLLRAGANARDLAITILETGCDMDATHYPLGDRKTGDSANWGLFKNNWYTIRKHCSQFQGLSESEWMRGQVLNTDPAASIKCQREQIKKLGLQGFYAAQRGVPGETDAYRVAVEFILNYLNQGHLHDNWVTYYMLHAV